MHPNLPGSCLPTDPLAESQVRGPAWRHELDRKGPSAGFKFICGEGGMRNYCHFKWGSAMTRYLGWRGCSATRTDYIRE